MITIQDRLRHPHSAVAFERAAKEAADRIDALEAEIEMWKATANAVVDFEKVELRKQVAALTKDADRWRWWCDAISNQDMCLLEQVFAPIPHDKPTDKKALDAVVDAAIKESK